MMDRETGRDDLPETPGPAAGSSSAGSLRGSGRPGWIPVAIVVVGLLATALLVRVTWAQDRDRQRAEALRDAQALQAGLQSGLDRLEDRSRSLTGLMSGVRGYSPTLLARYDSLIRVDGPSPWRAFAVGPLLRQRDRASLREVVAARQREYRTLGYPAFRIFPDTSPTPEFVPLVLVQPEASRENVFGYDMASEPNRRMALLNAVRSGLVELTTPVTLTQDEPGQDPSLLLVTAFRRDGLGSLPPDDPWRQLADTVGIVATSFTPASLVRTTLERLSLDQARLEVTLARGGAPLLAFPVTGEAPADAEGVPVRLEARGATHQWVVEGSLRPWAPAPFSVWGALLLGLLVTALTLLLHLREHGARMRLAHELDRQRKELRASEARAAQYQRSEALGRLTGGIAHDFNNLLSVILGNLELLRVRIAGGSGGGSPDAAGHLLEQAESAANRAAVLTRRLLTFGRQARLAPRVVEVGPLLRELEPLLRTSVPENITLTVESPGERLLMRVDRVQLESALLNLVVNARDACRGGDTIRVSAERMADRGPDGVPGSVDPGISVPSAPGRPPSSPTRICITVTDTGSGMSPEVLQRASDPFYTTKPVGQGSGLGLPTTAGFVQQSGGELLIDSVEGEGTTVRICLPEAPAEEPEAAPDPAPEAAPESLAGCRILLVEDEAGVRRVLATGLKRAGATVITADRGSQAVEILEEEELPDLVLTDQVMPGSTPGTEVVRVAKERGIPAVLMSGYAGDQLDSAPVPPDAFVQKPVRLGTLLPLLTGLVRTRRS